MNTTQAQNQDQLDEATVECERGSGRNVFVGVGYMLHGALYFVLYIPCLIVICRPSLIKHSCYKIMAAMGFMDLAALLSACFATGVVSVVGNPLCFKDAHRISRLVASAGLGAWVSYGFLVWFLAINRLIEMYWPLYAKKLFTKNLVIGFVAGSVCVGVLLFTVNSEADAGLTYLPNIGLAIFEMNSNAFVTRFVTIFDIFIAISLVLIYILIVIKLYKKTSVASGSNEALHLAKMERSVTIQSVVVCSITAIAALGYTILPMFKAPLWSWTLINIIWQMAHGLNAVIYLTLNQTIITGVKELCGIKIETVQKTSRAATTVNKKTTTHSRLAWKEQK